MKIYLLPLFIFLFTAGYTNAQVTANAGSDQSICIGDTLTLEGLGLDAKDTGTYQWRDVVTATVLSNKSLLSLKITSMNARQFRLIVTRVTYQGTFIDDDTVEVLPKALPTFKYNPLAGLCYMGGPINLTARAVALAIPDSAEVTYYQKNKKPSWITGGPVGVDDFIYDFQKYVSNTQVPALGLKDTICYQYTDQFGCYNSECKPIRLYQTPVVVMNDGIFCQKAGLVPLDNLVVQPSTTNRIGGIQSWRCISVPQNSGVDPNAIITDNGTAPIKFYMDPGQETEPEKTGDYVLEYCFQNATTGCKKCDTAKVHVIRLPEIEFDTLFKFCVNWPKIPLDSLVHIKGNKYGYTGGTWQCVEYGGSRNLSNSTVNNAINNSVVSQKYFNPKTIATGGQYLLKFTDGTSGCGTSDSVDAIVNGLPIVQLAVPDSVCSDAAPFRLTSNYSDNDTNGRWLGPYVTSGLFDPASAFASGANKFKVKYIYTNPLTWCSNIDSTDIIVTRTPDIDFQWTRQGADSIFDFSVTVPGIDSTQFSILWDFGNGQGSSYKNPSGIRFNISDTLQITCTVIANWGCGDTLTKELYVTKTGLKRFTTVNNIVVFPNPSSGKVQIKTQTEFKLQVADITGKIIAEGDNLSELTLPQGFYLFRFTSGDATAVKKVIIR